MNLEGVLATAAVLESALPGRLSVDDAMRRIEEWTNATTVLQHLVEGLDSEDPDPKHLPNAKSFLGRAKQLRQLAEAMPPIVAILAKDQPLEVDMNAAATNVATAALDLAQAFESYIADCEYVASHGGIPDLSGLDLSKLDPMSPQEAKAFRESLRG